MVEETGVGYSGINIFSNMDYRPIRYTHVPSSTELKEFKEVIQRDSLAQLKNEIGYLLETAPKNKKDLAKSHFTAFSRLFQRFLEDVDPPIDWNLIEKLPTNAIREYSTLLKPNANEILKKLNKLVVIKLNGGLGTSMGCRGPKSIIQVRDNLNFLDLTVQQIEHINRKFNVNVPLVLMNSFNTDKDTEQIIQKYKGLRVEIYTFNQSCFPRVSKETLLPMPKKYDIEGNIEAWYPPGHGDFYDSFKNSGLLTKFIENGREYCFISNIDNLGATVDLNILNMLFDPANNSPEFVMEVTDKTKADVKGGTLIQYEEKMRLLELAQVPKIHVEEFKSVKKFKFFNTNNLWINLKSIEKVLSKGFIHLEIIVNQKSLDNNLNIIQLETAVGAAMKSFNGALGINVPRSRFLPVKKTSDLLLVMSNLYKMRNGSLYMSPLKIFPTTPSVKLGDKHFAKVKSYLSRFATIPDILELDHLTVSGDVTFGRNVTLKGTVIIIANHGEKIDIPSNAILENKIVSGNLRIQDH